jgi:hypothetical protein
LEIERLIFGSIDVDNLASLKADSNANCRSVSVYVVVPDHRMKSTVAAARQIKRDDALIADRVPHPHGMKFQGICRNGRLASTQLH